MDVAYDHIQEEVLRSEETPVQQVSGEHHGSLNADLQEAYKSISSSAWGARLGGFLGTVRKQGESYYQGARQEASAVGEEAFKGFADLKTSLVGRTRSLSTSEPAQDPTDSVPNKAKEPSAADTGSKEQGEKEALQDSDGLISRFQREAAKRLKDIEKAEDAADEALLKFGTNLRNFLRDAVSVAPPSEDDEKDAHGRNKVLFESKDSEGKRVFHTTRLDAQLHIIHCSLDSFTKDPASPEYKPWQTSGFDVEQKTDAIAADLERYEELRRAMERLVPEKVEYAQFWKRYYFLRMVIESEEQRRRELLKGAALPPVEEVAWDEDSDSASDAERDTSTPQPRRSTILAPNGAALPTTTTVSAPTTTAIPPAAAPASASAVTAADAADGGKLAEPRKSQDLMSQPDSDASYDLVSGATSRAPGSPGEEKGERRRGKEGPADSDEEDWE